jgi:hypothetical protein
MEATGNGIAGIWQTNIWFGKLLVAYRSSCFLFHGALVRSFCVGFTSRAVAGCHSDIVGGGRAPPPPCQYHIRRKFDCTPGSEGKQERLAGCLCVYMRENKQTKVEARGRATCQSLRAPSIRTSGPENIEEKNNSTCRRCFPHFKGHVVDSLHSGPDLALSLHKKANIIQNIEHRARLLSDTCPELCKHRFMMQPFRNPPF